MNRLIPPAAPIAAAFAAALAAAVIGAPAARAAEPALAIAPGSTLLTIAAEGRVTREPDLAVFTAGVTTQGRSAGDALAENARRMNAVIAALKAAGIEPRDVQTSNLAVNPVYADPPPQPVRQPRGPVIVGYQAANQVTVRQRKLGEMGRTIDALVSAGANEVNGPAFQIDDQQAALDEARVQAIKAARARAELYARGAGLRVVRIVSLSESGGYAPQPRPMVMMRAAMAEAAPSPVAPGEVGMTVGLSALFELAP